MKITKTHLSQIIKEEMSKIMEYGMYVNPDGSIEHPDEDGNPVDRPASAREDIMAAIQMLESDEDVREVINQLYTAIENL